MTYSESVNLISFIAVHTCILIMCRYWKMSYYNIVLFFKGEQREEWYTGERVFQEPGHVINKSWSGRIYKTCLN